MSAQVCLHLEVVAKALLHKELGSHKRHRQHFSPLGMELLNCSRVPENRGVDKQILKSLIINLSVSGGLGGGAISEA